MSILPFMGELYLSVFLLVLLIQCGGSLQDSSFVNSPGTISNLSLVGENKLESAKPSENFDRLRLLSGALAGNVKNLREKEDDDDQILNDETNSTRRSGVLPREQSGLPSIPLNHVNGMYIKRESSTPDSRLPRQAPMIGGSRGADGPGRQSGAGAMNGLQGKMQQQWGQNPEEAQKLQELGADARARFQQQVAQNQHRAEAWKQTSQDSERAKKLQEQMGSWRPGQGDGEHAQMMKEQIAKMKSGGPKKLGGKKGSGKRRGKGLKEGLKDRKKGSKEGRKKGSKARGGHKGNGKGKKDKSGSGGRKGKKGRSG